MRPVRKFFIDSSDHSFISLLNGHEILSADTTLSSPEIGNCSALISKQVISKRVLNFMMPLLDLQSLESIYQLYPDAYSWEMNQQNRNEVINSISQLLSQQVGDLLQQKMAYCIEELTSNAIFALNPNFKKNTDVIINEKPVQIFLDIKEDMQVLIIRDQYGEISSESKSRILSRMTSDMVAPNTRDVVGGAGLGLNLVRELCNLLIIRHHSKKSTESCCVFYKKDLTQAPFLFLEEVSRF